jgi:hypothetical protein
VGADVIIAAILQAMIKGPQIIAALRSGKMTDAEAEAAWDATVAPGWNQAYNNWKETPDGRDNPVE